MSREKIFEETRSWDVATDGGDKGLLFQDFKLDSTDLAPGDRVSFETVVKAQEDDVFYIIVTKDKGKSTEEEIIDLGFRDLEAGQEESYSMEFIVPEDVSEVSLTCEGGYEA